MENDLRKWMRLVEAAAPVTVRVYHGSPEAKLTLRHEPLYGVRDFGFAASYALERGKSGRPATVYSLDFHFRNLCADKALDALFADHGIEPWPSAAGVFIDNPEFLGILTGAGYDGLTALDFGFRDDFEELPVWMVTDAAAQARIVGAVVVTAADLGKKHAP